MNVVVIFQVTQHRNSSPSTKTVKPAATMWSSADAAPAAPTKNLGMTAPISTAGPEPRDLELTSGLQDSLIPHGCFESEEELNHRMDVLR